MKRALFHDDASPRLAIGLMSGTCLLYTSLSRLAAVEHPLVYNILPKPDFLTVRVRVAVQRTCLLYTSRWV